MAPVRIRGGNIRSRLLLIVLGALVPVVLLSAWQGKVAYENSRQLVVDRLRANARALAESERDPFIIARHTLTFAARSPAVRNFDGSCSETLRSALLGADSVLNFLRTDANGKARCSVLPFEPGEDMSHDRWWLEARGKTGLFVASPQFGRISKRPVLIMVLPMAKSDGSFHGTLSAGISLERLASSLQRSEAGKAESVFIVNSAGVPILQLISGQFTTVPNLTQALSQPVEIQASDGSNWTVAAAPLFGEELFVVYAEPISSVMAAQLAQTRFAIALQVLTLLLTSLAIWIGSQRLILRWLSRLQHLTKRFADGDFTGDRHSYADAPEEIADLSDHLHNMAESIGERDKKLREALAVETALTREVHHRVKNNLQIVTSLLTLQGNRLGDPIAREVIGQARSRIGALGLIHRLLYEEQHGSEQGSVNVQLLLGELCAQQRAAHRERIVITLDCSADDSTLPVDLAVPITLFTVEAITNAYRHAFDGGAMGTIQVEYTVSDGIGSLSIADNGSGFMTEAAQPQMGLDLMQAFAEQLGGEMKIESGTEGAKLTLTFPVDQATAPAHAR